MPFNKKIWDYYVATRECDEKMKNMFETEFDTLLKTHKTDYKKLSDIFTRVYNIDDTMLLFGDKYVYHATSEFIVNHPNFKFDNCISMCVNQRYFPILKNCERVYDDLTNGYYANQHPYTGLIDIPENIVEMDKLKVISLSNTTNFPESMCELKQLHTLKLSHPKFSSLPNNIDKLQSLKKFYIYDSNFDSLPESFWNLKLEKVKFFDKTLTPDFASKMPSATRMERIEWNGWE